MFTRIRPLARQTPVAPLISAAAAPGSRRGPSPPRWVVEAAGLAPLPLERWCEGVSMSERPTTIAVSQAIAAAHERVAALLARPRKDMRHFVREG